MHIAHLHVAGSLWSRLADYSTDLLLETQNLVKQQIPSALALL
jgi:hypothetical protein